MISIQIKNIKHDKMDQPYDFFVDRRTCLGNPFKLTKESDREKVCLEYAKWFKDKIEKFLKIVE